MLFTGMLTGCLGPRGEFWAPLRCGPDVSTGALEDQPGSALDEDGALERWVVIRPWQGWMYAGSPVCWGQGGAGERSRAKRNLVRGVPAD